MAKQTKCRFMLLTIFFLFSVSGALGSDMLSIQVQDGQIRATPSFLGKIVGTRHYGDRVAALEKSGEWTKVNAGGIRGWMHSSALTQKKISLQAGEGNAPLAASNDELSLAGKGFNEQVESAYKSKNPKMDYAGVNRMEAIKVSPEEMAQFLKQGELSPQGGAQ